MENRPRAALTGLFVIAGIVLFSVGAGQPSTAKERRAAPPVVSTLGNLIVSRSVYVGDASTVTVGNVLPGGDPTKNGGKAVADGTYPGVWKNESIDASFGVTSPMIVDRTALSGTTPVALTSFTVPNGELVTSFPSKSEMSLHLSTDGTQISLMGYVAQWNELDVSNSDTPGHPDPTNPVKDVNSPLTPKPNLIRQRGIALFDALGIGSTVNVTPVNAYSGNNGRSAILDSASGFFFLAGNAGNGGSPEPIVVVNNTGVQMIAPGVGGESTVVGAQIGTPGAANGFQFGFAVQTVKDSHGNFLSADKSGKDDNFRGIAIFNNTLFVTKGSGGNGIDTVYQVGGTGQLPTLSGQNPPLPTDASQTTISILPGFPTILAKTADDPAHNSFPTIHPFGLWFADANTLYVADEGTGNGFANDPNAGLQKWVLQSGTWQRAYTLQNGLNRTQKYHVFGLDTNLGLDPAPEGLRALTGRNNGDGTVTLFAVTSTTSAATDQGADPNQIVTITDTVAFTTPGQAAGESFSVVRQAIFGEVLRGVEFVPLSETAYLTNLLQAALNDAQALPDSDFKNPGEQQSLISVLGGLLADIQGGTAGNGVPNRLQDLIKKAGKITDAAAQSKMLAQLNAALVVVGAP